MSIETIYSSKNKLQVETIDEEDPTPTATDDEAPAPPQSAVLVTPFDGGILPSPLNLAEPIGAAVARPVAAQSEVKNILEAVENKNKLHLDDDEDAIMSMLLYGNGREHCYGIGACETYMWLNPRLVPVGWFVNPDIVSKAAKSFDQENLVGSEPEVASPNVDLVGALWSMSTRPADANAADGNHGDAPRRRLQTQMTPPHLKWRDIKSVIDDPYQSHGRRTEALYEAGLEKATGIPFNVYGICGIVVWYAKAGIDEKILKDPVCESYLRRVTHLKGALLATIDSRRKCVDLLQESGHLNAVVDNHNMQESAHLNATVDNGDDTKDGRQKGTKHVLHLFDEARARRHCVAWFKKIRGGGAQSPPCMSWGETMWTTMGSFIALLLLGFLHKVVKIMSEEEVILILGPFAAIIMQDSLVQSFGES